MSENEKAQWVEAPMECREHGAGCWRSCGQHVYPLPGNRCWCGVVHISLSGYTAKDRKPPTDPSHYTRGGIRSADVVDAWELGAWDGNALKYILRAKFKGKRVEDLEKAIWCLQREVMRLKGGGR